MSPGMCRPLCGLEPCQGHGDLPVAGRASCLSCRQRWTWLTPPPSWNRPPGFWDTSFRGSSRPEVATSQAPPEASGLSGPLPSHHGAPGEDGGREAPGAARGDAQLRRSGKCDFLCQTQWWPHNDFHPPVPALQAGPDPQPAHFQK